MSGCGASTASTDDRPVRTGRGRRRQRRLASSARSITRTLLRPPARLPRDWAVDAFGQHVDLVRTQLAPVPTLRALADSYRREASVATSETASSKRRSSPSAVDVAYAIRWLELEHRTRMPAWLDLAGLGDG